MSLDDEGQQDREWEALYQLVVKTMAKWGVDEPFGKGDYLIVDDNDRWFCQKLEVQNLKIFRVEVIKTLQGLLEDFPNWTIILAVDVLGQEHWPSMGVTIRAHEIIDGLLRNYLPEEFRFLKIPGSRPGTGYD
jgi:hypothetical protein